MNVKILKNIFGVFFIKIYKKLINIHIKITFICIIQYGCV